MIIYKFSLHLREINDVKSSKVNFNRILKDAA